MKLTLADLFAGPDHHLFAIEGDRAVFLRMDDAAWRRSIFHDGRIRPRDPAPIAVPLGPLIDHARGQPEPPRTGLILHVAQCGSTLLARGLDRAGKGLVLREPLALRQLGVAAANGVPVGRSGHWALVRRMLARRNRSDRMTIVKANVPVNCMLDTMAATDAGAPAILLYLRFEAYLLAVLRSEGHRAWVRRVTDELAAALDGPGREPVAALGDAQRAAMLWAFQMRAFDRTLAAMPHATSLDAEQLFVNPAPALVAAARQFEAPMGQAEAEGIVAGELFATYSKNPGVAFDNRTRLDRQADAAVRLADEVVAARRWLEGQMIAAELPTLFPRPLYGQALPLMD